MSRETNHWMAPKSPNNIVNTFFNTVHLLPKYLRFEHGGRQTCFLPRAPSDLGTPLHFCKGRAGCGVHGYSTRLSRWFDLLSAFGFLVKVVLKSFISALFSSTMSLLFERPGFEHWGVDSAAHCLKKASNWGGYIKIKPSKDALQVSQMTCLEQKGKIDELLLCQNAYVHLYPTFSCSLFVKC